MKTFDQKNYLIFAGTSTIAKDLIRKLKLFNCNVLFTSRDKQKAQEIKEEFGYDFEICSDLSDFDSVEDIFKIAKEKFGSIDGVVNFSGSILLKAAHQTKFEEYLFQEKFIYEHWWEEGDILLIDQLTTLHKRGQNNPEILAERILHRICFRLSNLNNYVESNNIIKIENPALTAPIVSAPTTLDNDYIFGFDFNSLL